MEEDDIVFPALPEEKRTAVLRKTMSSASRFAPNKRMSDLSAAIHWHGKTGLLLC